MNKELTLVLIGLCGVLILFLVYRKRSAAEGSQNRARRSDRSTRAPGEPLAKEVIIVGKLEVEIFSHVIESTKGPIPCWTFLSSGLLALGQKELSFTVKREPEEDEAEFPRDLLAFYETVYHFATQKKWVDEGGISVLGNQGPGFLRDDFRGILYTPPQALSGVRARAPYLTAIIVTQGEIEVAQQLGVVRVMALLGRHFSYFPTAPWLDRRRAELTNAAAMASSLLTKLPVLRLPGAIVRQDQPPGALPLGRGATVVLRIAQREQERLQRALGSLDPDSPLAILVNPDFGSSTCMVWEPDQLEAAAIAAPGGTGARLAGNFIAFAPVDTEDAASGIEDGFSVLLTHANWRKVRTALEQGLSIFVPGSGDKMNFALTWLPEDYENPVDGRTYHAPEWQSLFEEFVTEERAGAQRSAVDSVKLAQLIILQPEYEWAQRVSVTEMGAYILKLHDLLRSEFPYKASRGGFELLIQLEIEPPSQVQVQLALRPASVEVHGFDDLDKRIAEVASAEVSGPLRFQLLFRIWNSAKEAPSGLA